MNPATAKDIRFNAKLIATAITACAIGLAASHAFANGPAYHLAARHHGNAYILVNGISGEDCAHTIADIMATPVVALGERQESTVNVTLACVPVWRCTATGAGQDSTCQR